MKISIYFTKSLLVFMTSWDKRYSLLFCCALLLLTQTHMESGISLAVAGKAADASPHTDPCGCALAALGESKLLPY